MMIAALYPEYRQQAWRYARWLTGCDFDADEVVQDAFCKLAERESKGQTVAGDSNPAALLFTIVRNQSFDLLRRKQRQRSVALSSIDEPLSPHSEASQRLEMEDLCGDLREAISKLPQTWADALSLRVAGELTYDEIATVMQCTKNQVRTWIFRARQQLSADLSNHRTQNQVENDP
jgi:RNA polymerase sigma factor (sigma-70 family)